MSDRFFRATIAGLLALSSACAGRAPAAKAGIPGNTSRVPRSGLEVVGAMRRAHPSRDLKSLAFTIRTSEYRRASDSVRVTTSRGWASLPGRQRVELLPATRRSGTVRNWQRVAVFQRGRRVALANRVDVATLMTYDVFAQAADSTIMWLDSARVRYGLVRLDELDGRRVWVVGAAKGDTLSPQFWVDAERWRVVRVIQREPWNSNQLADVRFTEFSSLLDIPVPRELAVYRGGRLVQRQRFLDVKANPRVSASTFSLSNWRPVD
jgi:hypothetical protein